MTAPERESAFRTVDDFLQKIGGSFYVKTLGQLKYNLRFSRMASKTSSSDKFADYQWDCEKQLPNYKPLISVLVNICGDDTDSNKMLCDVRNVLSRQTYTEWDIVMINDLARTSDADVLANLSCQITGELVWVWDANVVLPNDFFEKMAARFSFASVMMAFTMPRECFFSLEKEGDMAPDWNKSFQLSSKDFAGLGLANQKTIPSVGCAVFRNVGNIPEKVRTAFGAENMQNPWPIYWYVIQGGNISYIPCEGVAVKHLPFQKEEALRIYEPPKEKHIMMVCYSLKSGGGETYPIYLSNEMRRSGYAVTLLNFDMEDREKMIAGMVDRSVPVIHMRHTDDLYWILEHVKADVVHTHHATTDYAVARMIEQNPALGRHIVTLHGMYETIKKEDCVRTIKATHKSCSTYIYVADKNLLPFKENGLYEEARFVKLPNGIPDIPIHPVKRAEFGLSEDDFVLVLASRGIPEKGWQEAISAVSQARARCRRNISLLILGNGEMKSRLERVSPDFVHFLGTVSNVRDYFAMADAGLLPSRFVGESFPIVIVECLMAQRPFIATDIGEVRNILQSDTQQSAGYVVPLAGNAIDVEALAQAIVRLAEDEEAYRMCRQHAVERSQDFLIHGIVARHLEVYEQ